MKLERMQVSGFGRLNGLDVELPGQVTVLYGPNEAGKSTLLGFVRALLFGIPSRALAAERYEPLRGGAHGGALTVLGDDGARWLIERYAQPPEGRNLPGTRGDRLRITRSDANGEVREATQEEMQRELLGGMSKAMFKQLFAVSLTELQEVGALQSEELSRYLFHAGIGGGAAVLRGEKRLVQDMDKLYRPRGRTQEIAQLLQTVERLEREAEAAKALLPRYNDVLEELERLAAQLAEAEAARAARGRETARLQKAAASRADWLQREAIRAELAALPPVARFPAQGAARWQALQAERERLALERGEWARRREALQAELARHRPDAAVLAQEPALRQLAGRLPGYEARQGEFAELAAEALQLERRLAECLRSINPAWGAEELRAFAGTVGERESVRRFAARFAAYDKEMELLRSERAKLERAAATAEKTGAAAVARVEASAAEGRRQFAMLVPQQPDEIRALWSELRGEMDRWREGAGRQASEQLAADARALAAAQMRALYRKLLAGSGVLTVALPVILWLTAEAPWGAVAAAAALLGLDAALALAAFRSAPPAGERRLRRGSAALGAGDDAGPEARLSALLSRLVRHPQSAAAASRSRSGAAPSSGPMDWDEEERQLRRLMEAWLLWDQRHAALEGQADVALQQASAVQDELAATQRELSRREADFDELAREWEAWLVERRLSADLSPEAASDVFRLAEQGRDGLTRFDGLTAKMAALRQENEQFEQECLAYGSEGKPDQAVTVLREALARLNGAIEEKSRLDQLSAKLQPLEEEGQRLDDRLYQVLESEQALLAEAGAGDGEELLRLDAARERRDALERDLRQLELMLFAGLDEAKQAELERLLQTMEELELRQQLEMSEQDLQQAEVLLGQLQEKRGRLLQEQENLAARCRRDDLVQQLEEQRAALSDRLDQYAVMAVCHELIGRARRVYEEERQPAVLQAASGYFAEMTGGTYRRIVMKMGTQELMAEHTELGPLESTLLSRGTAEQLYLAMRLALSEAVSGQGSLPLLLDDLFVNFDEGRLEGALSVLRKVADRQQIMMMTCHEHVVRRVQTLLPAANIVRM
ncbi:AAA family ATPase [Paenibacillus sp. DXFW5]|uniref:AAA family ATPase n=1 Tax=Paenibacillus rhizolycopersici TaxID=2780073 RepID=A0ABS2H1R3_9BACL|nr:AAA family ATPase [Paenibacillus rhizolycopersici]MBM6995345.1 AAA family ATPase [Paenibacillus rhizolycopersici]